MKKDNNDVGMSDLLTLPDINEMVNQINEQSSFGGENKESSSVEDEDRTSTDSETPASSEVNTEATSGGGESDALWSTFMEKLQSSGSPERKEVHGKNYFIKEDIINTLQMCDFNKKPVTFVVDAILRAFITLNNENLRKLKKQKTILI